MKKTSQRTFSQFVTFGIFLTGTLFVSESQGFSPSMGKTSSTLVLANPAASESFEAYKESTRQQSLLDRKLAEIYKGDRRQLFAALDTMQREPTKAIAQVEQYMDQHTLNSDDIEFVEDFLNHLRVNHRYVPKSASKKIQCLLNINNPSRLESYNCSVSRISLEPLQAFLESGGLVVINNLIIDRNHLGQEVSLPNLNLRMHFLSNTYNSYSGFDLPSTQIANFKMPSLLVTGNCEKSTTSLDLKKYDPAILYFSESCQKKLDQFEQQPSAVGLWIKDNKKTLYTASILAVVAGALYMKDKKVVFKKDLFSF